MGIRASLLPLRIGAMLVTVATLVQAGCENGDSVPAVRLFFGMENLAPCSSIRVSLPFAEAEAQLEQLHDGSPDCALDALLEAEGCDADFVLTDGDTVLEIELTGCEVSEAALFHCGFRSADLARLNLAVSARCTCANEAVCRFNDPTCYPDPGICVTQSATGRDCEDCGNDLDDDGDGRVDCGDDNCSLACHVGMTTVTCPPSSTVTTTSLPAATLPATESEL